MMLCPYCGAEAREADSSEVYGRSYGPIILCSNWPACDAYVGVHTAGPMKGEPKGTMADKELRELRKMTHQLFDPIWRTRKLTRHKAYRWLADALKIPLEATHIAMFDKALCLRAIAEIRRTWRRDKTF